MTSEGHVIISHRELFDTFAASTLYSVDASVVINPGRPSVFPWLSTIANSYEKYKFHKLDFEFQTDVGTSTNGSGFMSFDWDALDAAPSTLSELTSTADNVDFSAYCPMARLSLKPNDLREAGWLFVTSSAPTGTDLKTYYLGKFTDAATGFSTLGDFGRLYVNYTVELKTPQPGSLPWSVVVLNGTGCSILAPLGTSPILKSNFTAAVTPDGTSRAILQTDIYGTFELRLTMIGTVFATGPALLVTNLDGSPSSVAISYQSIDSGGTSGIWIYNMTLSGFADILVDVTGMATTLTSMSWNLSPINRTTDV